MNAGLVDLFGDDDESTTTSFDEDQINDLVALPPEVEQGNVEYKLKLIDPSPTRFEHLVTQMKWRLQEGLGEAIYQIGVEDNGSLSGLSEDEIHKSIETLRSMAQRLGASITIIRMRNIESPENQQIKKSAEVLVRKVPEDSQFIDMRIAVLGNIDCGKSTLISLLTHGELDNGRGKARLNLFKHLHEIQSGHTSSINKAIMGFNNLGEVQNFGNCRSFDEICENSSKILTFIDLAGHQKYMKTTIFGLTGYAPDFACLVINASNGIVGTTKEHLGFSLALEVPVFVVINKIDACTDNGLEKTLQTIEFLLKSPGCGKIPLMVNNDDDAIFAAQQFTQPKICPIFTISCVEGTNIERLKKFLNVLPPLINKSNQQDTDIQHETQFRVDEVYFKKKVGHILAGMLVKGSIQEQEKLMLGPFEEGEFINVEVQTVQRYHVPCRIVRAGQSASLSIGNLEGVHEKLRKGMVLVSEKLSPQACKEFEADIYLLFHANSISKGFQATIHVANVCQTATITYMNRKSIKTNERAKVRFKFLSRPEYLTVGTRLIIREGTSKGFGLVTNVIPYTTPALSSDECCSSTTTTSDHVLTTSTKSSSNKKKLSPNRTPPSPRAHKMAKIDQGGDDDMKAKAAEEKNTENTDPLTTCPKLDAAAASK